jgi:hypothetical protein
LLENMGRHGGCIQGTRAEELTQARASVEVRARGLPRRTARSGPIRPVVTRNDSQRPPLRLPRTNQGKYPGVDISLDIDVSVSTMWRGEAPS